LRVQNDDEKASRAIPDTIKVMEMSYTDFKSCITDNNATSTEYIDDFVFTNIAGSFFQNNNSILPRFTQYIRDRILPPAPSSTDPQVKYLIDAYSGSGLFTITLSSLFTSSTGIDISGASITSARENAVLNKLPISQCTFMAADAPELFKSVTYPKDETVVVIDPPRKGCDESFLSQLLNFGPKRVVYVSCNVHTQARDVGVLVRGTVDGGVRYKIESLRGFDFFPQTGHVEGVAVLSRVEISEAELTPKEQ
jgi:tRNA (uracil-5-)-methyltransferase